MLSANPERTPVYSSALIQERRKRILVEARRMIADVGIDGFSVRTLCRNADVAQRTLYNAFHSKDRLIALAIREAYEDVNRFLRYRTSADTLDGIIDRLIAVNTRNLKARNYTKAVASLYFSPTISPDIWNALRGMVFLNLRQWLDRLKRDDALQDWVDLDQAAGDFANTEYAVINDWAVGRLKDEDYVPRLITSVLAQVIGITSGAQQEEAIAMMRRIRETGKLPAFPKPVFVPDAPEAPEESGQALAG
ncbi:TetR/AcrR family transcriptional regulator [Sphingomonas jatrophae]|uniref:Transcriptional regulator, TetR family n=1 Tax=Sphingomonas jatrophae TaxID=1166337 RepID=A0A1I6M4F3_9SPHN|nr:TetR/AcrR family transcriptional regulator [Sphingomonas jatrophae]SFS10549.1 transcriptional regulator, TetR family [Sphingomonas jatrophae]